MPFVRSLASIHYILLAASISLNSEIINPCSCYMKRGLVYIAIIALSSRQPSSYSKYTKANICLLYDVRSVFTNKYTFRFHWYY